MAPNKQMLSVVVGDLIFRMLNDQFIDALTLTPLLSSPFMDLPARFTLMW